jgi:hypothetical protein
MAVMEFIKSTDDRKKIIVAVLKKKSGCTKITDVFHDTKKDMFCGKGLKYVGGKYESMGHFEVSGADLAPHSPIFMDKSYGKQFRMEVSNPTVREAKELTKEDVWGVFKETGRETHRDPDGFEYQSMAGGFVGGMMVARGHGHKDKPQNVCPIFKDEVPWKSATAICALAMEPEVTYWLEYVQGGNCISQRKVLPGGRVALRCDYMCW